MLRACRQYSKCTHTHINLLHSVFQYPRKVPGELMKMISLGASQTSLLSRYTKHRRIKLNRHSSQMAWDFSCPSHYLFWSHLFFLFSFSMQIYSSRDLEDNLNKIREICSDDKHDWDQRATAVSRFTSKCFFNCNNKKTFLDTAICSDICSLPFDH